MKDKIKAAKERLHKVYKDGEEYEFKLLKELETELEQKALKRQTTLTVGQQKEAVQMGVGLADIMELDMLKLKYKQYLKDNSGIKNKKIEKLIKDLEKKL